MISLYSAVSKRLYRTYRNKTVWIHDDDCKKRRADRKTGIISEPELSHEC